MVLDMCPAFKNAEHRSLGSLKTLMLGSIQENSASDAKSWELESWQLLLSPSKQWTD